MKKHLITVAALLLNAAPALAHPGHAEHAGFIAGLLHPLTGADHMIAMVLVGLWAGIAFPRRWWACPAAFMIFMSAGFAYGLAGGALAISEMLILASLVGLGLALLFDFRPPLAVASSMVALFAIGHGFAHGAEIPRGGNALAFAAGFLVSTFALHLAGLGVARAAQNQNALRIGRVAGAVSAMAGAALLWPA